MQVSAVSWSFGYPKRCSEGCLVDEHLECPMIFVPKYLHMAVAELKQYCENTEGSADAT